VCGGRIKEGGKKEMGEELGAQDFKELANSNNP